MKAELITAVINGAFQLIASLRRFGMTNQEINMRLERVDNGEDPITLEEVNNKINRMEAAIATGREMTEEDRVPVRLPEEEDNDDSGTD